MAQSPALFSVLRARIPLSAPAALKLMWLHRGSPHHILTPPLFGGLLTPLSNNRGHGPAVFPWTCCESLLSDLGCFKPDVRSCEGGPGVSRVSCAVSRVPELSGLKPNSVLMSFLVIMKSSFHNCLTKAVCNQARITIAKCLSVCLPAVSCLVRHLPYS